MTAPDALARKPVRHNLLNIHGIIFFTAPAPSRRAPEPVDQISERQQARGGERAPASRDHHERIGGRHIGPPAGSENSSPFSSCR